MRLSFIKISLLFALIIIMSCGDNKSSNSSNSDNYSSSKPDCSISTSKVRNLVSSNWSSIQSKADFKISNKKSFEVNDFRMDGDELAVDIFSRGYVWDITFTVSFEAYFDSDCDLIGSVSDVYNYAEK